MGMMGGKKLGELLVEKGLITDRQLEQALEKQRSSREFLGLILVSQGAVTEEGMLQALADQFGMPFTHLADERVDWDAVMRLARTPLLEHQCFPLRMDAGEVTVAIANPLDVWAISEMEKEAGFRRVRWVLMPTADILAAIAELQSRVRSSLGGAA